MLRKRNEYPSFITPKGVTIYPAVHEPDYKFKEEGEYHVRLRLDPDAVGGFNPKTKKAMTLAEILAEAETIRDEAYDAKVKQLTEQKKGALLKKMAKAPVIREEEDPESGEPTGFVILRATLKARIDIKNGPRAGESFEKKPDVFDATGKQLKKSPKVGTGSEVKLSIVPMDYETDGGTTIGTRFELQGVQIIKLIQGGSRDAASYGFGVEDGDSIEDEADSGFGNEGGGYTDTSSDDDRDF